LAKAFPLYREHRVLAHRAGALVIFVCIERLSDSSFAVSQAEFLYEDDDYRKRLTEIADNTVMLLLDPETPAEWEFLPTLEEAIAAHEAAFEGFVEQVTNAAH
jgi:hypothetical protein